MVTGEGEHGDPAGYREVSLGTRSHLEAISRPVQAICGQRLQRHCHAPATHRRGSHKYLRESKRARVAICSSTCLNGSLTPKAGITCALKNLVGINGDKAYLAPFSPRRSKWGGDEYRNESRWRLLDADGFARGAAKRSRLAYQALRPGWQLIKRIRGIETRLDNPKAKPKHFTRRWADGTAMTLFGA